MVKHNADEIDIVMLHNFTLSIISIETCLVQTGLSLKPAQFDQENLSDNFDSLLTVSSLIFSQIFLIMDLQRI